MKKNYHPFRLSYSPPVDIKFDPNLSFFYFLFRKSFFYNFLISKNFKFIQFPSYGFINGGNFEINIQSINLSSLKIFFMTNDELFYTPFNSFEKNYICNSKLKFSKLYKVLDHQNENLYTWNYTIKENIILTPFIYNCQDDPQELIVNIKYKNFKNYEDNREYGCDLVYKLLLYIYPIVSLLWFLNSLIFHQIHTDIHHFLIFLPLFKSGSIYFEYKNYLIRNQFGFIDIGDFSASLICYNFQSIFLMVITGLIISGWCILRDYLTTVEVLIYIILL